MTIDEILEQISKFRIKAKYFLKNNTKAFVTDTKNTYYFCTILSAEDSVVWVQHFKGKREGQKEKIWWADVVRFEEYKERVVKNG